MARELNTDLVARLAALRARTAPRGVPRDRSRYFYTRGEQVVSPRVVRSGNFATELYRALGGQIALDATTLSNALGSSPEAFRCITFRASTASTLPIVAKLGDATADGTPLAHFTQQQAKALIYQLSASAMLFGYGYARKRKNAAGYPTALEWVNPATVQEIADFQRGTVGEYLITDPVTGRVERVMPSEVVFFQDFDSRPGGMGLSRAEVAFLDINTVKGVATYAAGFFVNGAQPDGVLVYEGDSDPTQEDVEFVANTWRAQMKGAPNAHRTMVMPGKWKWIPLNAAPKDLAMPELAAQVKERIYQAFEVNPALTGAAGVSDQLSANSTYGAVQTQHIRDIEIPFVERVILSALNSQWAETDFDAPYRLEVDTKRVPALADAQLVKASTAISVTTSPLADYDEGRALIGMDAREPESYFIRSITEAVQAFTSGAITYNMLQRYTRGVQSADANGEFILISGQPVPVNRLREYADAVVEKAKAPAVSPFGLNTPPPVPTLPAPPVEEQRDIGAELFVGLDLANNPDLTGLQRDLMGRYPAVKWETPKDFHVTLLYSPACDPLKARQFADALRFLPVPELSLRLGSLKSFDAVGDHAIHFRIRENADLRDFQESVYQLALDCGIGLSSYSLPPNYIPHITLGYAPEKTTVYWQSKLAVTPTGLICEYDKQSMIGASGEQPAEQPLIAETPITERAAFDVTLAIPFADHAFIRAACRELDAVFRSKGLNNPVWTAPNAYRMELVMLDGWTPAELAKLIRAADYDAARKLDLEAAGFAADGGTVYLTVQPNDALSKLITSCKLDIEGIGRGTFDPPVFGVPLCQFNLDDDETVDLTGAPMISVPLVGATLALYKGDTPMQRWTLRSLTRNQADELEKWERIARNNRTRAFVARAVPPIVAAFVALSLEDEDADTGDVFDAAREMLANPTVRSFSETQRDFSSAITPLFVKAVKEESTRQTFAAGMRAQLRKFGLIAFRDGMKSAGSDPESFSAEQLRIFRDWQSRQSQFVTNLGAELYREGGITESQIALRVQMWGDLSLGEIYYLGAASVAGDQLYRWLIDPDAENCPDCLRLSDQVHPLSQWIERGLLPGHGETECKMGCRCSLIPAQGGEERGNFLGGASRSEHPHDHVECQS